MSELELIAAIAGRLGARGGRVLSGPGDDAAVVRAAGVEVTSIDLVSEGVHFELDTHDPADVGHKALGSALSDLAAMGASAGEAYVGLALPSGTEQGFALELVSGLEALAERCQVTVAGGDVVSAPALVVSVAVTGFAEGPEALVYRDGARPGHLVGVTGELGGSGAGLALLRGNGGGVAGATAERLVARHRRPEPRLALGAALARAGASAMLDSSDGVATDAGHLAESSGARLTLRLAELPLAPGVAEVARSAGRDPVEFAATAGEDYELLLTASPERRVELETAAQGAGSSIAWLGEVQAGAGLCLVSAAGEVVALRGYEHG